MLSINFEVPNLLTKPINIPEQPEAFKSISPRYNTFPSGLGKGHDCGVVGAWLEVELAAVDVASIAAGLLDELVHKGIGLWVIILGIVFHVEGLASVLGRVKGGCLYQVSAPISYIITARHPNYANLHVL